MKALFTFVFLIIIQISFINAQTKIWNNWYFVDSVGLNFNTHPPSVQNGKITDDTTTASSSISDTDGNLLFYTDGINIFDNLHDTMPNGKNISGLDTWLYTAIIVPKPDNPYLYYIFSASSSKIYYSIVDIRLNNGKGDIVTTQKTIALSDDTNGLMAIAQTADKKGYWIVSHSAYSNPTSNFYSFKLTDLGINNTAVNSPDITYIAPTRSNHNMRISPDSKTLAAQSDNTNMVLYHFDNETATLQEFYSTDLKYGSFANYHIHSFEFSENSEKLYVTVSGVNFSTPAHTRIYQFDLSLSSISPTLIFDKGGVYYSNLQMGPDKNIYVKRVGFSSIAVIEHPNMNGTACNLKENVIVLNRVPSFLSAFPYCYFFFTEIEIVSENVCFLQTSIFAISNTNNIQTTFWNFGDSQTSTELEPTNIYANAGTYTVTLTVTYTDNQAKTISKEIEIYNKPFIPIIWHD